MSFSVYNCYKVNTIDPYEVQTLVDKLLIKEKTIKKARALERLAKDYTDIIDGELKTREEIFDKLYREKDEDVISRRMYRESNILDFMIQGMNEKMKRQKISNTREPFYDFNYSIYIYFLDKEFINSLSYENEPFCLLRISTENDAVNSMICDYLKEGIIEDFHYQNSTDKPNDISDDEWDFRYLVLNKITSENKYFMKSLYDGVFDNIFDWDEMYNNISLFKFLTLIPDIKTRRRTLYNDWFMQNEMKRILSENKKGDETENHISAYHDASKIYMNLSEEEKERESKLKFPEDKFKIIDKDFIKKLNFKPEPVKQNNT